MKKLAIYLSIILVLFALLYFIDRQSNKAYSEEAQQLYSTSPDNLNESTRKQLNNSDYQNIILPTELQQNISNEEDVYVYFFSPLCNFCVATTPRLNEIAADAGVDIRQYNVLEFERAWTEFNLEATPTLIYFEDGIESDRLVGGFGTSAEQDAAAETGFIEFFDKHKSESE
jgi:thioredoxin 1